MKKIGNLTCFFSSLVVLEFLYIFYLETIMTASETTSRVFAIPVEVLKTDTVQLLFQNQGVYNLMIAVVLVYTLVFSKNKVELLLVTLIYILVVALYGGWTSDISIFFKQGSVPLLATLSLAYDIAKNRKD
ncbi:DUF1304 family protein [Streptococcus sp. zg-86]|uniref:DUF1304 family protein n=1 Tax=Streptococcus zhangguiae TaxID=2664091 RepID=A0A6I4RPY6_9STRE|nr:MULTISPECIES: DUF1304 family protein [unclassified Streptococcus]MTB64167.1 DUF1304 family protein [Streptococcus sp. zg-86]MTB90507.1 DUF1304 family protein [Streptococcus sp. zg-36]MWV56155.1 DUF1304 family protein [Streptococcus sp. zg-70]QTH48223.1 DUF1304 family protein [Streptococcus sp. zg-86]